MCRLLSHKAPQFHGAVRELIYFPVLYQQVFLWLSGEFRQARSSRFKIFHFVLDMKFLRLSFIVIFFVSQIDY